MKKNSLGIVLSLALLFAGCAAHTNIEPLGQGNVKADLSLGGPVVAAFDTHLPVPYATLGMVYGLKDNINVDGNFHLTSLPYGIFGLDLGMGYFPVLNDGLIPTLGIHPQALTFISIKGDVQSRLRLYPTMSATAAWHLGRDLVYTGLDYTYPLSHPDYDNEAPRAVVSPFLGYRTELGKSLRLTTELKWQGANVRTNQMAVEYTKAGGYGALGILFSIERSF